MKLGVLVIAFSYIYSVSVVSAQELKGPAGQAEDIERIATRSLTKTIEGASFELQLNLVTGEQEINAEISAAFDGGRVRLKQRHRILGPQSPNAGEWFKHSYSIIKDDVVIMRNSAYEHGTSIELQSFYPDLYASSRVFFPQFIGTAPCGIWQMPESSPRGFLGQGDHHATQIAEEELDGLRVIRVNYDQKLHGPVSVWYNPDRNGLITRMYESAETPSGLYEREVRVNLKEWVPGVWFPETIETTTKKSGLTLSRENAVVSEFKMGVPKDEMFSVAGVDLPIGGVVTDETFDGPAIYFRWEKDGLHPMTDVDVLKTFPPKSASYSPPVDNIAHTKPSDAFGQIIWYVNAIALIGVAGYLFVRFFVNRRAR